MAYTIENSFIRVEPQQYIGNVLVREAVIFGNNRQKVKPADLQTLWRKEKRESSKLLGERRAEALMLANAQAESGFYPFIFRYERGQHTLNPNWRNFSVFDATSGGLFQLMGFNWKKYGVTNWDQISSVEKQLTAYDKFVSEIIERFAIPAESVPGAHKDLIYRTIAGYGKSSISGAASQNTLSEIKYKAYKKIESGEFP